MKKALSQIEHQRTPISEQTNPVKVIPAITSPAHNIAGRASTVQRMHQLSAITQTGRDFHALSEPIQQSGNLPLRLQEGIEALTSLPMQDVRVHYNSPKPAQLRAYAYAQGSEIHLAPGQERHLQHEAWHVVQQKQGRVKPTLQLKGIQINDDSRLEHEADEMGSLAMKVGTNPIQKASFPEAYRSSHLPPIQRAKVEEAEHKLLDFKEISKMNVAAFAHYAAANADWTAALNADEHQLLFSILEFTQSSESIGFVGSFAIDDISGFKELKELCPTLPVAMESLKLALDQTNAKTTMFREPITMGGAFPSFSVTMLRAAGMKKMMLDVPDKVIEAMSGNIFLMLSDPKIYPNFTAYQKKNPEAVFQNASDFALFCDDPDYYLGSSDRLQLVKQRYILNPHRYSKVILERLEQNMADEKNDKPLTLVINTTDDSVGAFVNKDSFTPLIMRDSHKTLLIESRESLASNANLCERVAAAHGYKGKIAELVICGHGATQELALGPTEQERLNVKRGKDELTIEFFKTLLNLMFVRPTPGITDTVRGWFSKPVPPSEIEAMSRIVFSACDVNGIVLPSKPEDLQGTDLKEFLENNPSLVQTIITVFDLGAKAYPQVIGANASIHSKGQSLVDEKKGNATLKSQQDPSLTASKLEYVETGKMVGGAIGAAVHCLTFDKEQTIQAIQRRLKQKATCLEECFILATFQALSERNFDPYFLLNERVNVDLAYKKFLKLKSDQGFPFSLQEIGAMQGSEVLNGDRLLPHLRAYHYADDYERRFVTEQIHLHLFKTSNPLMQVLTEYPCAQIAPYLSWEIIEPQLDAIFDSQATPASISIAICALSQSSARGKARKFLLKIIPIDPTAIIDPKLSQILGKVLDGYAPLAGVEKLRAKLRVDEDALLAEMKIREEDHFVANIQPMGSPKATVYVRPKLMTGKFKKTPVAFHRLPERAHIASTETQADAEMQNAVDINAQISIMGETTEFYAIRTPGNAQVAFVKKDEIEIAKQNVHQDINEGNLRKS